MTGRRSVNASEAVSFEGLRDWIGRSETREDLVTPAPVVAMSAMLDRDDPMPINGDELPALWHWLYFLPLHRRSELGADGHARLGGFLPPVPLPRRMWAGSRIDFHQPLCVGDAVSRTSRIADVTPKTGRSGALVFVRVLHEISGPRGLAITEEHDIVYREAVSTPAGNLPGKDGEAAGSTRGNAASGNAKVRNVASANAIAGNAAAGDAAAGSRVAGSTSTGQAPADPEWTREIVPDEVLLFRYSALTFNGHRIHYDRPYVTEVEGYAGLVVHGPLIATLLLEHLRDRLVERGQGRRVTHFEFRARNPIIDTERFAVCAMPQADDPNGYRLWARNSRGVLCMDASARVEP
jgi:3-methylfumaryl-CoA hydratase